MKAENLWCDKMVCDGEGAWLTGAKLNALFYLDFNTKVCEFIDCFPDEPIMDYRVNSGCMKIENELYFFPDRGEYVCIYNIISNKFSKIILNNPKKLRILIGMVFHCNDCIYAFSNGLEQIIEISVSQKRVIDTYSISGYIQESGITRISSEGCIVHENIYFTIPEKNLVCEFSTKTKKILDFNFNRNIMPQTICYDGKNFWMTGKTKEIVRWNEERNEVVSVHSIPDFVGWFENRDGGFRENTEDGRCQNPLFRWSLNFGDKIWFIPYVANKIIYIDKNTCEIGVCDVESEYESEKSWFRAYQVKYSFECVFQERYIFLYSYKNQQYLLIDTITNTAQKVDIILEKESGKKLLKCIREKNESMVECNNIEVFDLIRNLTNNNRVRKATEIGKDIWQKISEEGS